MSVKQLIKEFVPQPVLHSAKVLVQRDRLRRSGALSAFQSASTKPEWLTLEILEALDREYPLPAVNETDLLYTDAALEARAHERLGLLKRVLGNEYKPCTRFIEAGAADCMVSRALLREGKDVLATDIQADEIDPRAKADGVPFELRSVTDLGVPDGSCDVLFSFDSFEHFDDPEAALQEAIRVVRPGGYVYLRFGPLYYAADGMHLGARCLVPYASAMFERETVETHLRNRGFGYQNDYCNEWTLSAYRELFDKYAGQLERQTYYEHWDLSGLDMIRRFPSCFRSKSADIEEFLVGVIEVLFRRKNKTAG